MSLTITQRPSTTFEGKTVKWSAVGNPIVYKFTRKDYTTATVTDSAGNLRITIGGGVDLTSSFPVGASVFYYSDNLVYSGTYTVLTSSYSAPDNTITFSGGYTSAATTGYVNLNSRLNYKAEFEIWDAVSSTKLDTLRVSPTYVGNGQVDVSKSLWAYMSPDVEYSLSTITGSVTSLYKKFYIKHRGVWIGGSTSLTDDVANKFYSTYGANKLRNKYGGFMSDYVVFNTEGDESPKFLIDFTPIIWRGLPFRISAIINDDMASNQHVQCNYKDITGASVLPRFATAADYKGTVISFNPLELSRIPTTAVSVTMAVDRTGVTNLMNELSIPIKYPCDNAVVLQWINSKGGEHYWCFETKQEYSYTYQDGKKYRRMVLFADNLTLEQWEGLNDIGRGTEKYDVPILELTRSSNKTSAVIGSQIYLHDYRNTDLNIVANAGNPTNLQFTTDRPHGFSFVKDDIVYINSQDYAGYFYADPVIASPTLFLIRDIPTSTLQPFTTTSSFVEARKVNLPIGCVFIESSGRTQTDKELHSITITVELPEVFTT